VSPTHDGKLTERLKQICEEVANICGLRVKVMERGGAKIRDDVRSNPSGERVASDPSVSPEGGNSQEGVVHIG
jgi:hypothetical protein